MRRIEWGGGCIVVAVVGALGAARVEGADAAVKPVSVPLRVRVVEMDGLEWRERNWASLDLLDHQGATLVWATDARTLGRIVGASAGPVATVTPRPGSPPAAAPNATRLVTWMQRRADGPPGAATSLAFKPVVDAVGDGAVVTASGRRVGESLAVTASVRDSRLVAVHTFASGETLAGRNRSSLSSATQVPEVVTTTADGSWTIEAGEALVISLGVHSASGPGGLRERLVLIDGGDLDESSFRAGESSVAAARVAPKQSMLGYALGRVGPARRVGLLGLALAVAVVGLLWRGRARAGRLVGG